MKLLLDTHAWLWFILGDPSISSHARTLIQDPANERLISPASYWELAIKISLGKYRLAIPYHDFVRQSIALNAFKILHISARHTAQVATLPYPSVNHKDPFDRLLVSQALVEGLAIVSSDTKLDGYGVPRLW